MSTIVIGGTGFIGRRLVPLLLDRGEDVVCIDVNPRAASYERPGAHVRMIRADVRAFDELIAAMSSTPRPERVINLAYHVGSDHPSHLAFKLNVLGMENCLEAARVLEIGHVVIASSLAVNGPQGLHGDRPIAEDAPRFGRGQYATHKIFNEMQADDFRERYGMQITCVRPANVTGGDKVLGSIDHVLCITNPARGEPVSLPYRDLMRCPIYVDDVADIFARIALASTPRYSVYNTGGTPVSLGEVAELVQGYLPNAEITFEHEVGGNDLANNPLVDCYLIDNSRLFVEFGIELVPYHQRVLEIIEDVQHSTRAGVVADGHAGRTGR